MLSLPAVLRKGTVTGSKKAQKSVPTVKPSIITARQRRTLHALQGVAMRSVLKSVSVIAMSADRGTVAQYLSPTPKLATHSAAAPETALDNPNVT